MTRGMVTWKAEMSLGNMWKNDEPGYRFLEDSWFVVESGDRNETRLRDWESGGAVSPRLVKGLGVIPAYKIEFQEPWWWGYKDLSDGTDDINSWTNVWRVGRGDWKPVKPSGSMSHRLAQYNTQDPTLEWAIESEFYLPKNPCFAITLLRDATPKKPENIAEEDLPVYYTFFRFDRWAVYFQKWHKPALYNWNPGSAEYGAPPSWKKVMEFSWNSSLFNDAGSEREEIIEVLCLGNAIVFRFNFEDEVVYWQDEQPDINNPGTTAGVGRSRLYVGGNGGGGWFGVGDMVWATGTSTWENRSEIITSSWVKSPYQPSVAPEAKLIVDGQETEPVHFTNASPLCVGDRGIVLHMNPEVTLPPYISYTENTEYIDYSDWVVGPQKFKVAATWSWDNAYGYADGYIPSDDWVHARQMTNSPPVLQGIDIHYPAHSIKVTPGWVDLSDRVSDIDGEWNFNPDSFRIDGSYRIRLRNRDGYLDDWVQNRLVRLSLGNEAPSSQPLTVRITGLGTPDEYTIGQLNKNTVDISVHSFLQALDDETNTVPQDLSGTSIKDAIESIINAMGIPNDQLGNIYDTGFTLPTTQIDHTTRTGVSAPNIKWGYLLDVGERYSEALAEIRKRDRGIVYFFDYNGLFQWLPVFSGNTGTPLVMTFYGSVVEDPEGLYVIYPSATRVIDINRFHNWIEVKCEDYEGKTYTAVYYNMESISGDGSESDFLGYKRSYTEKITSHRQVDADKRARELYEFHAKTPTAYTFTTEPYVGRYPLLLSDLGLWAVWQAKLDLPGGFVTGWCTSVRDIVNVFKGYWKQELEVVRWDLVMP